MDLMTFNTLLSSQEEALKAILLSCTNIPASDLRTAIDQHTARLTRLVRNAVPSPEEDTDTIVVDHPSPARNSNNSTPSKLRNSTPSKPSIFGNPQKRSSSATSTPSRPTTPAAPHFGTPSTGTGSQKKRPGGASTMFGQRRGSIMTTSGWRVPVTLTDSDPDDSAGSPPESPREGVAAERFKKPGQGSRSFRRSSEGMVGGKNGVVKGRDVDPYDEDSIWRERDEAKKVEKEKKESPEKKRKLSASGDGSEGESSGFRGLGFVIRGGVSRKGKERAVIVRDEFEFDDYDRGFRR